MLDFIMKCFYGNSKVKVNNVSDNKILSNDTKI